MTFKSLPEMRPEDLPIRPTVAPDQAVAGQASGSSQQKLRPAFGVWLATVVALSVIHFLAVVYCYTTTGGRMLVLEGIAAFPLAESLICVLTFPLGWAAHYGFEGQRSTPGVLVLVQVLIVANSFVWGYVLTGSRTATGQWHVRLLGRLLAFIPLWGTLAVLHSVFPPVSFGGIGLAVLVAVAGWLAASRLLRRRTGPTST